MADSPLLQFVERYGPPAGEEGPERLVREVFGAEPDIWQTEVLRAYGRNVRGISIASCHGPGKTCVVAWCIWHQLLTRYPQKTAVTAPTGAQLTDALEAEVRLWFNQLPLVIQSLYDVKSGRVELVADRAGSFATFKTARPETPEALQGIHAPWVLLVGDEASAIPEPIFAAAVGSMSGERATTILASNPTRTSGLFFESQHRLASSWVTIQVSAVPRAGAHHSPRISQAFIDQVKERYGEDSNEYRVRVLGMFPRSDTDTLIPWEWIEGASGRDIQPTPGAPIAWGLDVARFGDCATVLAKRRGSVVIEPLKSWTQRETMQVVGLVKIEWDMTPPQQRPVDICVDAIGMGVGVADRLRELGLPARAVNVSETPAFADMFVNQRAELYWRMREWFGSRAVSIPPEPREADPDRSTLQQELARLKYKPMESSGKMRIESKDEMRKRGFRSPDKADALMLTFASTAATALLGGQRRSWNQPLLRNRKVV